MSKKGIEMTLAQAQAHQERHGFALEGVKGAKGQMCDSGQSTGRIEIPRDRMNKTEREYSLILEAQARKGEILKWKFEGISLSWGADPETGKPMWYTPDFLIVLVLDTPIASAKFELHEIKGAHIRDRDLVRFKGCRAEWPMFHFEMHQKKAGTWTRIH